jgi:hypothetical protein
VSHLFDSHPILNFFGYQHLPDGLRQVSQRFCDLALDLAAMESGHPEELAAALRKLLEAKDCAVRAALRVRT